MSDSTTSREAAQDRLDATEAARQYREVRAGLKRSLVAILDSVAGVYGALLSGDLHDAARHADDAAALGASTLRAVQTMQRLVRIRAAASASERSAQ